MYSFIHVYLFVHLYIFIYSFIYLLIYAKLDLMPVPSCTSRRRRRRPLSVRPSCRASRRCRPSSVRPTIPSSVPSSSSVLYPFVPSCPVVVVAVHCPSVRSVVRPIVVRPLPVRPSRRRPSCSSERELELKRLCDYKVCFWRPINIHDATEHLSSQGSGLYIDE